MIIKRLLNCGLLAAFAMFAMQAGAANVDATAARQSAANFIRQHVQSKSGSLKAPSLTDFKLAHVEPSSQVAGANDFYAFNINGGGFVIIAGEDRAARVLGYSDQGFIDFNNLPSNLKDLLDGYKQEIEFLQTYKADDLVLKAPSLNDAGGVEPLIKSNWGQEMPYYLQCPIYQNEYCVVGCVATAMAQVMLYWQYPTSCGAIDSYYCYSIRKNVPALPATTFDYSLMLPSYCHWDWDNSMLIQDVYTDEQAQEAAKLSRYCGQAVEMDYSPEGSGAYTWDQLSAMKWFGYSSNAQDISKSSSWGSWGGSGYTTAEWEAKIKTELDAGRPILYSASDPSAGGHAFICDGYNAEGYFHFNLGWYGTCDGWYLSTSLKMTHRDGDELNFRSGHEMLIGVEPPAYCIINSVNLDADNNLLVLGGDMNTQAKDFSFRTSYNTFNLMFGLVDMNGNKVCTGNAVPISKNSFEQGSTVNGQITLPADLEPGNYNLGLYYYTTSASDLKTIANGEGVLTVVGRVAKYNAPFTVTDATTLIQYVMDGTYSQLNISDVTMLLNYMLAN